MKQTNLFSFTISRGQLLNNTICHQLNLSPLLNQPSVTTDTNSHQTDCYRKISSEIPPLQTTIAPGSFFKKSFFADTNNFFTRWPVYFTFIRHSKRYRWFQNSFPCSWYKKNNFEVSGKLWLYCLIECSRKFARVTSTCDKNHIAGRTSEYQLIFSWGRTSSRNLHAICI